MQEAAKDHDSCINNLHTALGQIGHPLTDDPDHYLPPSPFNLWMAVSLKNEGSQLSWDPPAKVSNACNLVCLPSTRFEAAVKLGQRLYLVCSWYIQALQCMSMFW